MFSVTIGNKNTWTDWHLTPTSPPYVVPPEPVLNYVDIPNRSAGPLDLTEVNGDIAYGNREGNWEFIIDHDQIAAPELYPLVLNHLHGKYFSNVRVSTDPTHYYKGRLAVEALKPGASYSTISIKYTLRPYKYLISNDMEDGF